jgi:hypothetical protein
MGATYGSRRPTANGGRAAQKVVVVSRHWNIKSTFFFLGAKWMHFLNALIAIN